MKQSIHKEPLYVSSWVDFFISIFLIMGGILINWKYLRCMEEDDRKRSRSEAPSLIKDVMTTYTKFIMVITPYYILLNWFLNEEFLELPEWFQYALCYDQYVSIFGKMYYGFNSLVISLMRFMFIVHHDSVQLFGKDKAKSLFYHVSYGVPTAMAILHAFTLPVPEYSENSAKLKCNSFYSGLVNNTNEDINTIHDGCSPLLSLAHIYVPIEVTKYIGYVLKLIAIITLSNVIEGILYWKIFNSIKK